MPSHIKPSKKPSSPKPKKSAIKKSSPQKLVKAKAVSDLSKIKSPVKKNVKFSKFEVSHPTYSKTSYDRKGTGRMVINNNNVMAIRSELNSLMSGLYIHPDSRKNTKKY